MKTHTGRDLGNITNLKVYVNGVRLLEAPAFGMALQERRMVAKARRRERRAFREGRFTIKSTVSPEAFAAFKAAWFRGDYGVSAAKVLVTGVIAYRPDNTVALVQRHDGTWTLPGGKVADGETFTMAGVRELAEETGLVGEVHGLRPSLCEVGKYLVATLVVADAEGHVVLSGEHRGFCWVTATEALGLPLAADSTREALTWWGSVSSVVDGDVYSRGGAVVSVPSEMSNEEFMARVSRRGAAVYSGVLDELGASRGEAPTVAIIDGKEMSHLEFTEFLLRLSDEAWGVGAPVKVEVPAGYGPPVLDGAAREVRKMEILVPCPLCAGGGIMWDTDADDHEVAEPCTCPAGVAVAEQEAAFDAGREFAAEFATAPADGVFSDADLAKCREAVAEGVDALRAAKVRARRPVVYRWNLAPLPAEEPVKVELENASPVLRRLLPLTGMEFSAGRESELHEKLFAGESIPDDVQRAYESKTTVHVSMPGMTIVSDEHGAIERVVVDVSKVPAEELDAWKRRMVETGAEFVAGALVPQDSVLHCRPGGLFEEKPVTAADLELWRSLPTSCVLCSNTGRVVVDDVLGPGYEIYGPCSCGRRAEKVGQ